MKYLSNLFKWQGEIGKSEFLILSILSIIATIVIFFIEVVITKTQGSNDIFLFSLAGIYLVIATLVKRLRDAGLSLWWIASFPVALFSRQLVILLVTIFDFDLRWFLDKTFTDLSVSNSPLLGLIPIFPFLFPFLNVVFWALTKPSINKK